jgi:hypothetical protein
VHLEARLQIQQSTIGSSALRIFHCDRIQKC